jgi:hypothetical protein
MHDRFLRDSPRTLSPLRQYPEQMKIAPAIAKKEFIGDHTHSPLSIKCQGMLSFSIKQTLYISIRKPVFLMNVGMTLIVWR